MCCMATAISFNRQDGSFSFLIKGLKCKHRTLTFCEKVTMLCVVWLPPFPSIARMAPFLSSSKGSSVNIVLYILLLLHLPIYGHFSLNLMAVLRSRSLCLLVGDDKQAIPRLQRFYTKSFGGPCYADTSPQQYGPCSNMCGANSLQANAMSSVFRFGMISKASESSPNLEYTRSGLVIISLWKRSGY